MQVFAHRGASGEFPENTLLAFEQAVEQQADGIEFDVQHAKDGLVIVHDRTIEANAQEYWLADLTVAELQRIPLAQNQYIPTLWRTLSVIKGKCDCNIELKTLTELSEVRQTIEKVLELGWFKPEQIIVSAFNHHLIPEVQSWKTGVATAAIIAANPINYGQFIADLGVQAVHADVQTVSPELIEDLHQNGLQVRVYTVDHARDIYNLLAWGADAVFSNFPKHAKHLIQTHHPKLNN